MDDARKQDAGLDVLGAVNQATQDLHAAGSQQHACRILMGLVGYLLEVIRAAYHIDTRMANIRLIQAGLPWTGEKSHG